VVISKKEKKKATHTDKPFQWSGWQDSPKPVVLCHKKGSRLQNRDTNTSRGAKRK